MESALECFDSDLLCLMTGALDAAVTAGSDSHVDIEALRFAAARHILAAVGAGERDSGQLAHSTLTHIRSTFGVDAASADVGLLPCAHRSSS